MTNARAPKPSGGIGVLIKNDILTEYSMRVIDKSYDGIMALEFIHKHVLLTT